MPAPPDLSDGDVFDFTGVFTTRRRIDTDDQPLYRLCFEGGDEDLWTLLVPEERECTVHGLRTGHTYDVQGVQYCQPPANAPMSGETCPECDMRLREQVTVDGEPEGVRAAVRRLGPSEAFGLATEATRIVRADRTGVDDWTPMETGRTESTGPQTFVCEECGSEYDEATLRRSAQEQVVPEDSAATMAAPAVEETVGLATGGAKDTTNFRENIETGYTPQPGSLSTEGLFYDYSFETGGHRPQTDALFAPRYATGVSEHPLTGETEYLVSVGLDSTLAPEEFQRPRLDLVAVLDVSGSMDSPFDAYYYDEGGNRREAETSSERKIDAATQALCALTEQLHDSDRLGVVLYNNRAHVAKPLREVGTTDMAAIRRHIREVSAGGGTNMEDGFAAAWDLLQDEPSGPDTEQRIVFTTDMMPNMGHTDESELRRQFAEAAADGIHTTFLGIGLDENADLADAISDVRGANHYFVHSVSEFERRLGEEFAYMVSPLVYDLQLEIETSDCTVAAVHGVPGDTDDDRLIHVTTLFPSPTTDGETRGGVILVTLDGVDSASEVELAASWRGRDGQHRAERVGIELPDATDRPTYDHSGVRKATALARYATALRAWASDVHARAGDATGIDDWIDPNPTADQERESVPLAVPDEHARKFATLREYLATEARAVGDEDLRQEVRLLEQLCDHADIEVGEAIDRQEGE